VWLIKVMNTHKMPNHVGRVLLIADESLSASDAQVLGLVVRLLKVVPHCAAGRSRASPASTVAVVFVV